MRLRTHTSQSWWRRNAPGRKAAICSTRGAQSNEAASRTGGGYFTMSNSELFNCSWPADGGDAAPGSTSDMAMLSMVPRAMATPKGTERAVFQFADRTAPPDRRKRGVTRRNNAQPTQAEGAA